MSWYDRRSFLLMALLAGCGFQPAFGPDGAATGLQNAIAVADPADKNGFDLVERLEQRLGRSRDPVYALTYDITTRSSGVGITPDNAITRFTISGTIRFALTRRGDGATLSAGTVESFTSYSASATTVSTLAAERDAGTRLMRLLADQIVAQLVATSATFVPGSGKP